MARLVLSLALAAVAVSLPAAQEPASPVVLELFTSQGCSSCPPADRLLSTLGSSGELADRVVPLAFHVDYWNYIGWTDPFSSAEWTERQHRYAATLGSNRVYTPELVVDGRTDLVGSDRRRALEEIERALAAPRPATVALSSIAGGPAEWTLEIEASLDGSAPPGPHRLLVAVTESGLETPVERGENGGKRLHNDHVVRLLTTAGELAGPDSALQTRVAVPLAPEWDREHIRAVAFVQDPATGHVLGAAVPLAATR